MESGRMSTPVFPKSQGATGMKNFVLAMLLVAAITAVAQTAAAPAQPAPQTAAPAQAAPQQNPAPAQAAPQQNPAPAQPAQSPAAPQKPPQKKEIKDPAEYNAYVGAAQQTDAAARVSGLEAFVTQYPNSVMKEDALELLMGAYQQMLGQAKTPDEQKLDQAKTLDTAQKVLVVNPCNLRALALLAYTKNAQQNFAEGGQFGEKGLQCLPTATKPEGTSDADFQKLKDGTATIFNGAVGVAAFQSTLQSQGERLHQGREVSAGCGG